MGSLLLDEFLELHDLFILLGVTSWEHWESILVQLLLLGLHLDVQSYFFSGNFLDGIILAIWCGSIWLNLRDLWVLDLSRHILLLELAQFIHFFSTTFI